MKCSQEKSDDEHSRIVKEVKRNALQLRKDFKQFKEQLGQAYEQKLNKIQEQLEEKEEEEPSLVIPKKEEEYDENVQTAFRIYMVVIATLLTALVLVLLKMYHVI